jgi:hypothetical protein
MKQYVKVTTISQFLHTYYLPVSELQKLNPETPISGFEREWAQDIITCEEAKEVGQEWIGETILSSEFANEASAVVHFKELNPAWKNSTDERIVAFMENWKVDG